MDIENVIKEISSYFNSIEIKDNILMVCVTFDEKWGVYPSEDGKINVVQKNGTKKDWYYYCKYEDTSINDVFNLIKETINMNLTASAKIELLTKKIEELKIIFSEESLDRLSTLSFTFKDEKPKKRKYTRRKKQKTEDNDVLEPTVDEKEEQHTIELKNKELSLEDSNNNKFY